MTEKLVLLFVFTVTAFICIYIINEFLSRVSTDSLKYQYITVVYLEDGKKQRSGWVSRASYVEDMMYFEWVNVKNDWEARFEVPQQNIVELMRSEWHSVEDTDELPNVQS